MDDAAFNWCGEYDENWPLPKQLAVEQYRRVIFRPDAHFVDGHIIPRDVGDILHGQTVGALTTALLPMTASAGISPCISLRLEISPKRIRVCDVVLPKKTSPVEQVPSVAPIVCAEVLAQGQLADSEIDSLADYSEMGVRNVWLLDPNYHKLYTFDKTGLKLMRQGSIRIEGTPFSVRTSRLFFDTCLQN